MTVAQLLQRIMRNLTVRDVTQMSAGEQTRVFDALNDAVREWFTDAPPQYRTNDESVVIHAPLQISATVVAESTAITITSPASFPSGGYSGLGDLVGKAVSLAGDDGLNRFESYSVAAGLKLLGPYMGPSGSVSGTVACDTVAMGSADWSIIGDPIWQGDGLLRGIPLAPWFGGWNELMVPIDASYSFPTSAFWRPLYWWTGSHIPSLSTSSPYWYLHLWPLPGLRGRLTYKAEYVPPIFTVADFASQRDVPVPDQFVAMLCYLAIERLMGSAHWNPAIKPDAERENIARARTDLLRLSSKSTDTAPRAVGTPFGF